MTVYYYFFLALAFVTCGIIELRKKPADTVNREIIELQRQTIANMHVLNAQLYRLGVASGASATIDFVVAGKFPDAKEIYRAAWNTKEVQALPFISRLDRPE